MIEINGSAERIFHFPAARPLAYAFFSDFNRTASFLPYIDLVKSFAPDQHRLRYQTSELGMYRVTIYADVRTQFDPDFHSLVVLPLNQKQQLRDEVGFASLVTQGFYTSHSVFRDNGPESEIHYSLQLRAQIPTPFGLRVVPGSLMNHIANSITDGRIREIIDAFIKRSIAAYPRWLAQEENGRGL